MKPLFPRLAASIPALVNNADMNRRRLLLGIASASAGAAIVGVAGITEANASAVAENLELIRLGDLLPATEAEFLDAERSYWDVVEKWEKRWPLAPDAIVKPWLDSSSWERGLRGIAIQADGSINTSTGVPAPRSLHEPQDFENSIAGIDRDMRRKRAKHPLTPVQIMDMEAERAKLADKLALARDYEAAKERLRKASGYPTAYARLEASRKALSEVVGAIMAQPETTMAGIIIKAQALALWGRNPQRIFHVPAWEWPHQFAASVLRIAGDYQQTA